MGVLPTVSARAETPSIDARARWLAGLATPESFVGSGADGTATLAEWKAYARDEHERWQRLRPRIEAMEGWAARELVTRLPPNRVLFYPFGGPDVLHAVTLFSSVSHAVLVGLEPIGVLPDETRPPAAGYFSRLGAAQDDLHRLTFFRTRPMAVDFEREGVLAVLVATLVRLGAKIVRVTPSSSPRSVRIDWTTRAGAPRRLDYLQMDLSNVGLRKSAARVSNLRALAPFVTFVKAGSYLLGDARFSNFRSLLLEDSAVIVQDDTGIPFRYFDERWAVRLFGRYEAPKPPFESRHQQDLKEAFEQRAVGALPFGIGYRVQSSRSHLLVATRVSGEPNVEPVMGTGRDATTRGQLRPAHVR